jgi:hypothetical protein
LCAVLVLVLVTIGAQVSADTIAIRSVRLHPSKSAVFCLFKFLCCLETSNLVQLYRLLAGNVSVSL